MKRYALIFAIVALALGASGCTKMDGGPVSIDPGDMPLGDYTIGSDGPQGAGSTEGTGDDNDGDDDGSGQTPQPKVITPKYWVLKTFKSENFIDPLKSMNMTFYYDDEGHLTKIEYETGGGEKGIYTIYYQPDNKLKKAVRETQPSGDKRVIEYFYDLDGNRTAKKMTKSSGGTSSEEDWTYVRDVDSAGNRVLIAQLEPDKKTKDVTVFDDFGYPAKIVHFYWDGATTVVKKEGLLVVNPEKAISQAAWGEYDPPPVNRRTKEVAAFDYPSGSTLPEKGQFLEMFTDLTTNESVVEKQSLIENPVYDENDLLKEELLRTSFLDTNTTPPGRLPYADEEKRTFGYIEMVAEPIIPAFDLIPEFPQLYIGSLLFANEPDIYFSKP